jgi:WD40 repeat protein
MCFPGNAIGTFAGMLAAAALFAAGAGAADTSPQPQIVANLPYHDSSIAVFSDDGRYILTGNQRGTVRLWEAATGRLIRSYVAEATDDREYVSGAGFSAQLDVVVASDRYGVLSVWRASTGRLLRTINSPNNETEPQGSFTFAPGGKSLLSAKWNSGKITVWDTTSWAILRTVAIPEGDTNVTLSPDTRFALITGNDTTLIDTSTGAKLWSADAAKVTAFSSDASRVATDSPGAVSILAATTGKLLQTIKLPSGSAAVAAIAFSQKGDAITVATSDGVVGIWDIQTGNQLSSVAKPDAKQGIVLSRDGARVLSTLANYQKEIWNSQTGDVIGTLGLELGAVGRVLFVPTPAAPPGGAPVAPLILTANFSFEKNVAAIHRWDGSTGRLAGTTIVNGLPWNDYDPDFVFSTDGTFLVSGTASPALPDDERAKPTEPSITVWDSATGNATATLPGWPVGATVAVSNDGKLIFSIDAQGSASLWNRADAREIWTANYDDAANTAAFSPKGDLIATGGGNGIGVIDAATGKLLRFLKEEGKYGISSLAFSPDGRRILEGDGDWGDNASIWDSQSGAQLRVFNGHSKVVSSVAFSPDGKRVLTGGQDGTARIWNATTGVQERLLRLDSATPFLSVIFSPDGALVICGQADGSTTIWNSQSGALLVTLLARADGAWVTITPEGFFDASAEGAKLLHVVDALALSAIDPVFQKLHRPDLVREKLAGDQHGKVRAAAARLDLAKLLARPQ